jgi:peptide methionine sulfoxide reductase msrA/msrB
MKKEKSGNFTEEATFAGGCFWCVQGPFDDEAGISGVEVGYAGGTQEEAIYETVSTGRTQHREAIHMRFDPTQVDYRKLVEIFFRQIDPTDPEGQFADKGFQYTTAVYYHTDEQRGIAEEYIRELNASGKYDKPVATQIVPFTTFFPAEEEHQSFYKKNPVRYQLYKQGSGRTAFIKRNSQ